VQRVVHRGVCPVTAAHDASELDAAAD
jgi:hypothetical protein